jgi:leucyl-tRNA synthetase
MDPKNKKALVDPKKEKYWAPVDLYVGGAEHATRHLIYARFWHKFLYDIGVVSTAEPFIKLQNVGLIMGEDGRKMSKRFGNVVNPDDIVKNYGADSLRLYEMFMGPFDQSIAWSTSSIVGVRRFIEKVWRISQTVSEGEVPLDTPSSLASDAASSRASRAPKCPPDSSPSSTVNRAIHKAIKKVTEDIEKLSFNTAISTLMIAVNELEKIQAEGGTINRDQFEILLQLVAPFAPHVAEELWYSLGNKKSVHISEWPKYDDKLIVDDEVNIIVQVNGKVRGSFKAQIDANEAQLESNAKEISDVKKWLEGKSIKKVIVVKGKLVSIVVA